MQLQDVWNTNFLTVVRQSELKKGAILSQLLFFEREEVEELIDDYGYEEILERKHDEELKEILGEELFQELERRIDGGNSREQLIAFVNGLGFHILDWIMLLEAEFSISGEAFAGEAIKKLEKRLPHFPYVEEGKVIFEYTMEETVRLLNKLTDGAVDIRK
ncbi:MAG: hypothetical protein ACE3JP_12905 [Ectobacillus sp.]